MQWVNYTTLPSRGLCDCKLKSLGGRTISTNSFSAADLESPNNTPPAKPPPDEVALALWLAHLENLAPPEVLPSELRSFHKSAHLSPGQPGVKPAAKAP